MKCNCKICEHRCEWKIDEHHAAPFCKEKMIFVHDEDYCYKWTNETLFDVSKLVVFAIVVVGIVIFLSKIL